MAFVELIALERCRENGGTFVERNGYELAVFRVSGDNGVYVMDNTCPHAGGNLSGGDLDGEVVRCPVHAWAFDLTTGICPDSPRARVRCYRAEIRDGAVWIDLPD